MSRFPLFVAFVLVFGFTVVLGTGPASADAVISGPGCTIDGNTLQVGGKIKDGKCWGGIDVRLHGSIAPNLNDQCVDKGGLKWPCGVAAMKILAALIKQHSISCYHIDGEFDNGKPIVTCVSGRRDLALHMVKQGMAKALHDQSKRYELEERAAIKAKKGIWK